MTAINVIDENSGNPFTYFNNKENTPGWPRYYKKKEEVNNVIQGIFPQLDLPSTSHCLEVGTGSNPLPSRAFAQLGHTIATLDSDYCDRHTTVSLDEYQKLKQSQDRLIPTARGRSENITAYLGDLFFVGDEGSELKTSTFDLIYFWGSLFSNGICRSVYASAHQYEYNLKIKERDRIGKVTTAIKNHGVLLATAQYFNGHEREDIEGINRQNQQLVELAVFWAAATPRKFPKIKIFTQSPKSIAARWEIPLLGETRRVLCENPLEKIMEDKNSFLFSQKDNYPSLQDAQAQLGIERSFENLGIIDAISIKY